MDMEGKKDTGSYELMKPQFHPFIVRMLELTEEIQLSSSRYVIKTLASGYATSNSSMNILPGRPAIV